MARTAKEFDKTNSPLTQYKYAICIERVADKGRVAKANTQLKEDINKAQKTYIDIYKNELKRKEVKIKLYEFNGIDWEEIK